jgi:hypothetical protein
LEEEMSGMSIVEVTIGLVFIYVLLSIFCTIINEFIAKLLSFRSRGLQKSLQILLSDEAMVGIAKDVWEHPLIKGNTQTKKGPSYIAADTFAKVLIDIIDEESEGAAKAAKTGEEITKAIGKTKLPEEVKLSLKALIDDINTNISNWRKNIQVWFDNSMDRISGIYKRKLQTISVIIAVILTVCLNVDTISISKELWKNPILRTQIADEVAIATEACKNIPDIEKCSYFQEAEQIRKKLELFPIGWAKEDLINLPNNFILKLIGFILTALAISLGAPFWFDILNQLNSIRSTGKKPSASAQSN